MVDWMMGALGDLGLFVAPNQMTEFARKWQLRFGRDDETVRSGLPLQQQGQLPAVPHLLPSAEYNVPHRSSGIPSALHA